MAPSVGLGRRAWRVLAVVGVAVGLTGCWPAPGGGPNRQGDNGLEHAISVTNVASFAPSWSAVIGGTPSSGGERSPSRAGHPVVSARGVLYISSAGSVHAFDPRTGAERWYQNLFGGDPVDAQVLALADDRVVVGTGQHRFGFRMLSFDARTGDPSAGPPSAGLADSTRGPWLASTVSREAPVPLQFHASLRVLNLDDPTEAWEGWLDQDVDDFFTAHLTLGGERVLHAGQGLLSATPGSAAFGNAVRAFPVVDGAGTCGQSATPFYACPQWAVPVDGTRSSYDGTGSRITGAPAISLGKVFVGTQDGHVIAYGPTGP